MDKETLPANENASFTQMTRNPKRELAKHFLAITLEELEDEGIHHQLLAEVLFEFLMIEMEPDSPVSVETGMTWMSQLHRFRDALQSQIDDIKSVYDEVPH